MGQKTEAGTDRQKLDTLKRRLFILACNVLLGAALLIYVTYSSIRVQITADVILPEPMVPLASLVLDSGENTASAEVSDDVLADLAPGDRAAAFANAADTEHCIQVRVSNAETVTQEIDGVETEVTEITPIGLTFRLRVYSTQDIPLSFVLVDEEENQYVSSVKNPDAVYPEQRIFVFRGSNNREMSFVMSSDSEESREFTLYVGWDSSVSESGSYRREVDVLEIRALADSVSGEVDVGHAYTDEDDIIIYTTPTPSPSPDPGA